MAIPATEFRTEVGLFDRRLSNQGGKYYVKNIYIDRLTEENLQKILQITVKAPTGARTLYLSRYSVTQYQCSARCSQCDRTTNTCLECSGFFINSGSSACLNCANGFYLKRADSNQLVISKSMDDICVKCHSSCKQCVGALIDQCTDCYNLFYLDSITYDQQCI